MADTITLTLSNPLNAEQAARLGAEAREYPTGSKITVPRGQARAIINAGYAAGVDPQDRAQVREVLSGRPVKAVSKPSGGQS